MNSLRQYIIEKFKINSKNIKNLKNKEWENLIEAWIKEWAETDFEYLMELIDKFLTNYSFNNDNDYEEFLKYENNNQFKDFLTDIFIKFEDDNEKQIQSLKK